MDQPSPEELQAYVEQLRATDPRDIVAQAFSMLGTSAEVKLGQRDARVLIDAMAGLLAGAGPHVPQLAPQMEQYVGQLKMAQVQMEAEQGQQPGAAADEAPAADGRAARWPAAGARRRRPAREADRLPAHDRPAVDPRPRPSAARPLTRRRVRYTRASNKWERSPP